MNRKLVSELFSLAIAVIASILVLPAPALGQTKPAQVVQADLDALVKAARAEGEVLFYIGPTENTARRTADAFFAKYGIKASFVRTPGATGFQRFSTEAESGKIAADLMFLSGPGEEFAAASTKKGWTDSISQAGLPVVSSGEYPARFLLGNTAVIQVAPWIMAYNTDKVRAADAPKEWIDLLHPRFKGQILIANPRAADAYYDHWNMVLDRLGDSYLTKLRDQNLRVYQGAAPATNALSAGEGFIQGPGTSQQYQDLVDKGAPIKMVTPDLASGIEVKIILTSRARSKSSNAGRLLANFLMSQEGGKVFNADPGLYTVYDLKGLPKDYVSPKQNAAANKDQILKLLGL